jgi:hypothetical protein
MFAVALLAVPSHAQVLLATALPDAPSVLLASSNQPLPGPPTQRAIPYETTVIVNGRPYHFPTPHEQFHAYTHELLGARAFLRAGIRSGIEQGRDTPTGWGQDFPGYMQRFGSAFGEAAIHDTIRMGMSIALHEDGRYLVCHGCSVGDKFKNAALSEFTARHGADGHRVISPTPITASIAAPLIAYATWYPPGNTSRLALTHVVFSVSTRIMFNVMHEFLFDHKTEGEKAQAKIVKATTQN